VPLGDDEQAYVVTARAANTLGVTGATGRLVLVARPGAPQPSGEKAEEFGDHALRGVPGRRRA
jgi:hypothetical protein